MEKKTIPTTLSELFLNPITQKYRHNLSVMFEPWFDLLLVWYIDTWIQMVHAQQGFRGL